MSLARPLAHAALLTALTSGAAAAAELGPSPRDHVQPMSLGLNIERITLPGDETMGLLGFDYRLRLAHGFSLGPSIYGANSGQRGGFFTGGLTGAWSRQWGPLMAELGAYVGGGGGGAAPQGSGLMLRPHAELLYRLGPWGLGAGVSRVSFPDGDISSTQAYLALRWFDETVIGPALVGASRVPADIPSVGGATVPVALSVYGGMYDVRAGGHKSGAPNDKLRYAGFAYRRALGGNSYAVISSAGAAGGGNSGYAEVLAGLGRQGSVGPFESLGWHLEGMLGLAGGGDVDTGGGGLRKVLGGLSWQVTDQFTLAGTVGLVESSGAFEAREARLELMWRGWDWGLRGGAQGFTRREFDWVGWEAAAVVNRYADGARTAGPDRSFDVFAIKIARELGGGLRTLGMAGSAVRGGAGGYSIGAVGLGWLSDPLAGCVRIGAEALGGAAGGGGIRTGGGAIWQAQAIARCEFTPSLALQVEAGRTGTGSGGLDSPHVGVALVYRFSRLEGRP